VPADLQVRAYLAATGVFALPPNGGPPEYAAAHADAARAASPLAYTVWVERDSFELRVWRDLVQRERSPVVRPPTVDFVREVALLIWAVPEHAPPSVLGSSGLILRRTAARERAVEVGVTPVAGGPAAATPVASGTVVPYAVVTVPRSQWPAPVPPPLLPPLIVTLTR
jgi:hypothetical protein